MAALDIDPLTVARQLFRDQPQGFPYEGFDLAELILPDGDDFGIKSDDEEQEEEEVETDTGFGSVIVVDSLPTVPEEKYDKLLGVLKKIYGQIGHVREVFMPKDAETKISKGFAFVEFSNPMEAAAAREQTQNYKLDKNHTFRVSTFDDIEKYMRVPDVYSAPEKQEYKLQEDLNSWMGDKLARDQFVIRYGDDTEVLWNDGKRFRAEAAYRRTFWTESFVQWSPLGSVLATIHRQGVAVWGGPSFTRLARFSHPGVQLIEFSPADSFMMSYSSQEPRNPRDSAHVLLNVFDARTGRKLRVFEGAAEEFAGGGGAAGGGTGAIKWPIFKWAGGREERFFARLRKNAISVYEAPECGLLDKSSIKLDGVQEFEWSPAEALLAAYTAEQPNVPAKIQLLRIPDKTEVRQKSLVSVSDVKILWHPQGDYLAAQVDRYTKTKKSVFTGFELFSIREKDIPMEVLELPNKADKVVAFAWEPRGHRFAVVHGDGPRPNVSFYSMKDDKGRLGVKHIGTLPNRGCNGIHWSPQGHNIVLSGLKGQLNGQLEFFNVDEFETMAAAEHFMATEVAWDPTGRYVASSVTAVNTMENGFNIWSFNGKQLYTLQRDRFFQFSWRPRLPSLLPPEKEAEIAKNLRQYTKRYDEEDEAMLMQADADVLQERQRLLDDWAAYLASKAELVAEIKEFVVDMYGAEAEEQPFTMESVTVEQVLDVREEPYNAAAH